MGSIGVEPEANRYKERDALNDKDATVGDGIVLWSRGMYSCISDDERARPLIKSSTPRSGIGQV